MTGPVHAAPIFDPAWRGFDTGIFGEAFAPVGFVSGDLDGDGGDRGSIARPRASGTYETARQAA